MESKFATGIALCVIGTLLACFATLLFFAYVGACNAAASAQHSNVVRWTLNTTRFVSEEELD